MKAAFKPWCKERHAMIAALTVGKVCSALLLEITY
jgi:hypothetical protein